MRNAGLCLLVVLLCWWSSAQGAKSGEQPPHIVKRFHLFNQTGAIGPLTIYTPKRDGLFLVNTFMVITVGNGNDGCLGGVIGFTDKVGPGQLGASFVCFFTESTGNTNAGSIPVPDKAGIPLTFSVAANQNWQGAKYDVTIVVEEL
jgi:hypothetical protein